MIYDSPVGKLYIDISEQKLIGIRMEGGTFFSEHDNTCISNKENKDVEQTVKRWLDAYFSGKNPNPTVLPMKMTGSPFQMLIWELLLQIPYGQTVTYGQMAQKVAAITGKNIMSAQAVGRALGKNPINIVIPCHRVIGKNGKLTGYAGGIENKAWLLRFENPAVN